MKFGDLFSESSTLRQGHRKLKKEPHDGSDDSERHPKPPIEGIAQRSRGVVANPTLKSTVGIPSIRETFKDLHEADGNRRSGNFQFTYHPGNEDHEKKLADLRSSVRAHNQSVKNDLSKPTERLYLRPRLGKDNPNAQIYRDNPRKYQMIAKAHGAHFDVYRSYDKSATERKNKEFNQSAEKLLTSRGWTKNPPPTGDDVYRSDGKTVFRGPAHKDMAHHEVRLSPYSMEWKTGDSHIPSHGLDSLKDHLGKVHAHGGHTAELKRAGVEDTDSIASVHYQDDHHSVFSSEVPGKGTLDTVHSISSGETTHHWR